MVQRKPRANKEDDRERDIAVFLEGQRTILQGGCVKRNPCKNNPTRVNFV